MKCRKCPNWENCEWRFGDECWYEPDDYDGKDLGSATVSEMEKQNEFIKLR